jgi:hypothetical protein
MMMDNAGEIAILRLHRMFGVGYRPLLKNFDGWPVIHMQRPGADTVARIWADGSVYVSEPWFDDDVFLSRIDEKIEPDEDALFDRFIATAPTVTLWERTRDFRIHFMVYLLLFGGGPLVIWLLAD